MSRGAQSRSSRRRREAQLDVKSRGRFSPRVLLVKGAAWVLVRTKDITSRMFESVASEQQPDAFLTWTSAGELHGPEGWWIFCEENTLTIRSYWTEQYTKQLDWAVYCGKRDEKNSDESPTDQEHRSGDRTDQAYRVQLTARNISFGCLIFGGAHCSIFLFWLFLRKALFQSTVFLFQQSVL